VTPWCTRVVRRSPDKNLHDNAQAAGSNASSVRVSTIGPADTAPVDKLRVKKSRQVAQLAP
jgi:hypothetical protein